jgi:hypothetical protein
MFVKILSLEGYDSEEEQSFMDHDFNPTWSDIEDAISHMEIDEVTGIYLAVEDGNENCMMVGGGQSGKFIVEVNNATQGIFTLINHSNSESNEKVNLVVGRQLGIYPNRICVDLETTLKAAKTYAELGICDPSLDWENPEIRRQRKSGS